jgi:hypothetical protein
MNSRTRTIWSAITFMPVIWNIQSESQAHCGKQWQWLANNWMCDDQFVAGDDQQIYHEWIVEPLSNRISREENKTCNMWSQLQNDCQCMNDTSVKKSSCHVLYKGYREVVAPEPRKSKKKLAWSLTLLLNGGSIGLDDQSHSCAHSIKPSSNVAFEFSSRTAAMTAKGSTNWYLAREPFRQPKTKSLIVPVSGYNGFLISAGKLRRCWSHPTRNQEIMWWQMSDPKFKWWSAKDLQSKPGPGPKLADQIQGYFEQGNFQQHLSRCVRT